MTEEEITNAKASYRAQLKRGVITQERYDAIIDFLESQEKK